jgi:adenosylmethionine-8-amino-7-oxononanoate aminotransferase
MLPNVDHITHTHSLKDMAYSKGLPEWGGHLAEDLERVVALHDASNIAAVVCCVLCDVPCCTCCCCRFWLVLLFA